MGEEWWLADQRRHEDRQREDRQREVAEQYARSLYDQWWAPGRGLFWLFAKEDADRHSRRILDMRLDENKVAPASRASELPGAALEGSRGDFTPETDFALYSPSKPLDELHGGLGWRDMADRWTEVLSRDVPTEMASLRASRDVVWRPTDPAPSQIPHEEAFSAVAERSQGLRTTQERSSKDEWNIQRWSDIIALSNSEAHPVDRRVEPPDQTIRARESDAYEGGSQRRSNDIDNNSIAVTTEENRRLTAAQEYARSLYEEWWAPGRGLYWLFAKDDEARSIRSAEDRAFWHSQGQFQSELNRWHEILKTDTEDRSRRDIESSNVCPPQQLKGEYSIGPAYGSLENAISALPHPEAHIAQIIHKDANGTVIRTWWEVSEAGLKAQAGHTEQKALQRVELQKGETLEIRGWHPPCPYASGCHNHLEDEAIRTGAEIYYHGVSKRNEMVTRAYLGEDGYVGM